MGLCEYLMANGQGSCTISVGNIGTYTSSVIGLEISDQADNPGGTFNLTQLREQARPLSYVMTDLLMNRSDIMMLYNYVLPGRPIPNLDFLNVTTITTTTTATITTTVATTTTNTTTTAATTITATTTTTTTITATHTLTPTITTDSTPTPNPSDTPATNPPGGGAAATAISYSLFITLVAGLLLAQCFVKAYSPDFFL